METIQTVDLARAEARLPRWMIGVSVVGTLGALWVGELRFAAGFALGAGLAVLSYYWLHEAIEKLFSSRPERLPWRVVGKFALRYPVAFGAIYVFYRTGWLPFTAVLAGLFVPVGGVTIEAAIQIGRGWHSDSASKAAGDC